MIYLDQVISLISAPPQRVKRSKELIGGGSAVAILFSCKECDINILKHSMERDITTPGSGTCTCASDRLSAVEFATITVIYLVAVRHVVQRCKLSHRAARRGTGNTEGEQ